MVPNFPTTRRGALAIGAGTLAALAGCSFLDSPGSESIGEWPSYAHDARNTGYVRETTSPPDEPQRLWTFETAFRSTGPPAVGTETTFHVVGHRLYALDRLDGSERWQTALGTWGSEACILANGTVYVGSSHGVHAVDATTGDEEWTHEVNGGVWGPPAYADGTVVVGTNAGRGAGQVIALNDGEAWTHDVAVGVVSGATIVDGTVYVGTWDEARGGDDLAERQTLYALDLADGSEQWTFSAVGGPVSVPAVTGGTVYVTCGDGNVYAVDAANGEEQWSVEVPVGGTSVPAVVEGVIYVGSTDGHVYAFSADDGSRLWRVPVGGAVERGIAVVDEVSEESRYEGHRQRLVYTGTADGTVAVVKTETEEQLASVGLGAPVVTPPFVRDRLIHVGTGDGNVHVLGE